MQTIYALLKDNGDGSSSIHWFRDKEIVDALLESDDVEDWYQNEGIPAETLTLPDDLDLWACGFRFDDSDYAYLLEKE